MRALLDVDSPVHRVGDEVGVKVRLINDSQSSIKVNLTLDYLLDNRHMASWSGSAMALPGEATVVEESFKVDEPGLWVIRLNGDAGGSRFTESIKVRVIETQRPVKLALVYHMHQPPWYMSNGKYYADWAFRYVYAPVMRPFFNGGPYLFHAYLHEKYKDIKVNVHLSPSLLKQWVDAVERGFTLINGEVHPRGSDEVGLVAKALDMYRVQVGRGQLEALTSVYAHTILGYLTSRYEMIDVVDEELGAGMEVTRSVLGVDPVGAWTPEMAWSMDLLDIYEKHSIRYTVLCGGNHFPGVQGDKGSIYEAYSLGGRLTIFFRDERLSDILSFQNNLPDERSALKLAAMLSRSIVETGGELVVIALDGENFIAMSKTPAMVGFMLDKLYSYLTRMQELGIVETVRLSQVNQPRRVITYVPTTSWLGGFTKWDGERREHADYWVRVLDTYRYMRGLEEALGGKVTEARYAIWHALDSDFWWAEFWTPDLIEHWINEARGVLDSRFKMSMRPLKDVYSGVVNRPIDIELEFNNDMGTQARFRVICLDTQVELTIQPGSSRVKCTVVPRLAGSYRVPIFVVSGNYIYLQTYVTLNVVYGNRDPPSSAGEPSNPVGRFFI
jgi:hypothetical protein